MSLCREFGTARPLEDWAAGVITATETASTFIVRRLRLTANGFEQFLRLKRLVDVAGSIQ
jgi:hypothetical protein